MKVLVIEDEPQAARRLQSLLLELVPEAQVVASIDSVEKSVQYFLQKSPPDLVLMDIHLADGLSFEIFNRCEVNSPVIFTTAFDEYALRAFKVNSIDYILKPIDKDELQQSLQKLDRLRKTVMPHNEMMENLHEVVRMLTRKYKSRFIVRVGERLKTIETSSILYFVSQERATFCITGDNRRHILDHTLDELEDVVDPEVFYRINRKYMVSAGAISDIVNHTNSRLKLILKNNTDPEVIVAREKVQHFKSWLDR